MSREPKLKTEIVNRTFQFRKIFSILGVVLIAGFILASNHAQANPGPCSFTYVTSGKTAIFTDTSTMPNITYWNWSFGDGTPNATTQNTTHTFEFDGTYTVNLTVADVEEATNSTSINVTVQHIPILPEERKADIYDVVIWGFLILMIMVIFGTVLLHFKQ